MRTVPTPGPSPTSLATESATGMSVSRLGPDRGEQNFQRVSLALLTQLADPIGTVAGAYGINRDFGQVVEAALERISGDVSLG